MASSPINSWQIDRETVETVADLILGAPKSCRWWLQPWNKKTLTPWKKSFDQPRQHIKKQRHYFANKDLSSQGYGFSSSHVWMWELDYKENWVPKNWSFELWCWRLLRVPWTARRSILKEISPECSLEGLMLKLKLPIPWAPDAKSWLIWKDPDAWKDFKEGGEGDDRGWDGWMASPTRWTWVWVNSGSWWWTGKPGVLQSTGSQRVGRDWATELNWIDLNPMLWSLFLPCSADGESLIWRCNILWLKSPRIRRIRVSNCDMLVLPDQLWNHLSPEYLLYEIMTYLCYLSCDLCYQKLKASC